MEFVKVFLGKYRKLTEYRDTIAVNDFMNQNLRGFFIITLILIIALLADAVLMKFSSTAAPLGAVPAFGMVGFLAAGELIAVFALCTGQRGNSLKILRIIALAIELLGVIYLMYYEYILSGGLYTYIVALLLVCSMLNLRLRESGLAILLLDFSYMAFDLSGVTAGGAMTFMNPVRFIILSSIMAFFAAFRTHIDYLINLRQRMRLEIISLTDPLTGLKNRRGMEKFVTDRNYQKRVAAVIFDVDDFKSYNDTYGHVAGDVCLQTVAGLVNKLAEKFDALPIRYGGEEFVVLFFGVGYDKVKEAVLNTLQEMRDSGMKPGRRAIFPYVTMSAGLAVTERPVGKDAERYYDLIAEADRNLYRAKTTGKNRLVD